MLLGLVRPTSGSATVLGEPARASATATSAGSAPSSRRPAFHPAVSGIDNLRSLAVLGGHPTAEHPRPHRPGRPHGPRRDRVGTYSLGHEAALGIAAALLGDPELVILDEPTNGLDPVGMQDIRRLIVEIAEGGRTVMVSSHLLERARAGVRLAARDRPRRPRPPRPARDARPARPTRWCCAPPSPADSTTSIAIAGSTDLPVERRRRRLVLVMLDDGVDPARLAAEINRRAHAAGIVLTELHHRRADLEARYLEPRQQVNTSQGGPA